MNSYTADTVKFVAGSMLTAAAITGITIGIVIGTNHSSDNQTKRQVACVTSGGSWTSSDPERCDHK
jgi:hypothetical protein